MNFLMNIKQVDFFCLACTDNMREFKILCIMRCCTCAFICVYRVHYCYPWWHNVSNMSKQRNASNVSKQHYLCTITLVTAYYTSCVSKYHLDYAIKKFSSSCCSLQHVFVLFIVFFTSLKYARLMRKMDNYFTE